MHSDDRNCRRLPPEVPAPGIDLHSSPTDACKRSTKTNPERRRTGGASKLRNNIAQNRSNISARAREPSFAPTGIRYPAVRAPAEIDRPVQSGGRRKRRGHNPGRVSSENPAGPPTGFARDPDFLFRKTEFGNAPTVRVTRRNGFSSGGRHWPRRASFRGRG